MAEATKTHKPLRVQAAYVGTQFRGRFGIGEVTV